MEFVQFFAEDRINFRFSERIHGTQRGKERRKRGWRSIAISMRDVGKHLHFRISVSRIAIMGSYNATSSRHATKRSIPADMCYVNQVFIHLTSVNIVRTRDYFPVIVNCLVFCTCRLATIGKTGQRTKLSFIKYRGYKTGVTK